MLSEGTCPEVVDKECGPSMVGYGITAVMLLSSRDVKE